MDSNFACLFSSFLIQKLNSTCLVAGTFRKAFGLLMGHPGSIPACVVKGVSGSIPSNCSKKKKKKLGSTNFVLCSSRVIVP